MEGDSLSERPWKVRLEQEFNQLVLCEAVRPAALQTLAKVQHFLRRRLGNNDVPSTKGTITSSGLAKSGTELPHSPKRWREFHAVRNSARFWSAPPLPRFRYNALR